MYAYFSFGQVPNYLPFNVTTYNSRTGLTQNQVLSFAEGKEGMYVATMNNVVLFDGHTFKPLEDETRALAHTQLFYHKKTNSLYGLSPNKMHQLITPKFQTIGPCEAIHYQDNNYTTIDRQGVISEYSYSRQLIQQYKISITEVLDLCNADNYFYIATLKGVYRLDKFSGETLLIYNGIIRNFVTNPFSNTIYALGNTILIIENGITHLLPISKHSSTIYRDAAFISENEFVITSNIGLFYFKEGKTTHYTIEDGISSNSLYGAYYYEKENCLFIGTENNGFMILNKKRAHTYLSKDNIGSQSFTSIIMGEDSTIYSASEEKIHALKGTNLFVISNLNKHVLSMNIIDKQVHIGTWGSGAFTLNNHTNAATVLTNSENATYFTYQNPITKHLWYGTLKGLFVNDGRAGWDKHPILHKKAVSIYPLSDNNFVIGTDDGVYCLNSQGKSVWSLKKSDGLLAKEVRAFWEDKYNNLWIGTYGGGLYVYQNGTLKSINNMPNCRLNQDVYTLARQINGMIYMSSNNGLWAIHEESLWKYLDGRINYLIPFHYGENDGILNTEFNGGFQNNHLIVKNKIFFPSIYGIIEFNSFPVPKRRKLIPHLTSVVLNDSIEAKSSIIERSIHTITLNFAVTNFLNENNLHYQYLIYKNGIEGNWSAPQKENKIIFRMLDGGDYIVKIRAIDGFNDHQPISISYAFTIPLLFYQVPLFIITTSLVLLVILYLGIIKRIESVRTKEKTNSTIQELKLRAIDARLNPHFMFNTLNSVVYFINIEQYEDAERQLQDFSLLLRQYLEKNEGNFLEIEEEIEMLRLYLSIQQKRYNFSFDYTILCPDELLKKKIPTMLLQPFVENAIIHGIAHSNKKGKLTVRFKEEGKDLVILIADNGIGMEHSAIINQSRHKHVSKGNQLIKEKIQVLKDKYKLILTLNSSFLNENKKFGTIISIRISNYDKVFDN